VRRGSFYSAANRRQNFVDMNTDSRGAALAAERCTIETAELILGLKRRHIQAMAARGQRAA
jgi:hypothetical protein